GVLLVEVGVNDDAGPRILITRLVALTDPEMQDWYNQGIRSFLDEEFEQAWEGANTMIRREFPRRTPATFALPLVHLAGLRVDGPSIGLPLWLAQWFHVRGIPPIPGIAATGNVLPDGSIGALGETSVAQKIEVALGSGYRHVIVPKADLEGLRGSRSSSIPFSPFDPRIVGVGSLDEMKRWLLLQFPETRFARHLEHYLLGRRSSLPEDFSRYFPPIVRSILESGEWPSEWYRWRRLALYHRAGKGTHVWESFLRQLRDVWREFPDVDGSSVQSWVSWYRASAPREIECLGLPFLLAVLTRQDRVTADELYHTFLERLIDHEPNLTCAMQLGKEQFQKLFENLSHDGPPHMAPDPGSFRFWEAYPHLVWLAFLDPFAAIQHLHRFVLAYAPDDPRAGIWKSLLERFFKALEGRQAELAKMKSEKGDDDEGSPGSSPLTDILREVIEPEFRGFSPITTAHPGFADRLKSLWSIWNELRQAPKPDADRLRLLESHVRAHLAAEKPDTHRSLLDDCPGIEEILNWGEASPGRRQEIIRDLEGGTRKYILSNFIKALKAAATSSPASTGSSPATADRPPPFHAGFFRIAPVHGTRISGPGETPDRFRRTRFVLLQEQGLIQLLFGRPARTVSPVSGDEKLLSPAKARPAILLGELLLDAKNRTAGARGVSAWIKGAFEWANQHRQRPGINFTLDSLFHFAGRLAGSGHIGLPGQAGLIFEIPFIAGMAQVNMPAAQIRLRGLVAEGKLKTYPEEFVLIARLRSFAPKDFPELLPPVTALAHKLSDELEGNETVADYRRPQLLLHIALLYLTGWKNALPAETRSEARQLGILYIDNYINCPKGTRKHHRNALPLILVTRKRWKAANAGLRKTFLDPATPVFALQYDVFAHGNPAAKQVFRLAGTGCGVRRFWALDIERETFQTIRLIDFWMRNKAGHLRRFLLRQIEDLPNAFLALRLLDTPCAAGCAPGPGTTGQLHE
ncbi:MAG TPA: hypothetical protein PLY73_07435, partial [Candidatus Ozemobacteraceae bacterium]|nr:hypothetical protein [Candidatus Ozemobacteraceae bacterium]